MTEVRFLPAVFADTHEAARRYDELGYEGLGDRFLSVFYAYVSHIQQHGKAYRVVYHNFRRVFLNPFPYALYYKYYREWLLVSLVIHTSRNPRVVEQALRERLPSISPES